MKNLFLEKTHLSLTDKFAEFGGWNMPILYSSIIEEHTNTRTNSSIFDISHMGIFDIEGEDCIKFIQYLVSNNLNKIRNGKGIYTHLLNDTGTVVDDLIFYKISDTHFLTIVNAGNTDKDLSHINNYAKNYNVSVKNMSDDYCLFAVQGPKSDFIYKIFPESENLKFFEFCKSNGSFIFKTGYTGDFGFEIMVPVSDAETIFNRIMETGAESGIKPAGLGARDSLRIEAGLHLYGHELTENIFLTETNLMWTVDFSKDFIGKNPLQNSQSKPALKQLIGFKMIDKGVPWAESEIINPETNETIGYVSSGTFSPYSKDFIGMGFIEKKACQISKIIIKHKNRFKNALIVDLPFFKRRK